MRERASAGMAARTMQGAGWLVGSRLVVRGLDLVLLLVLGRLLGPADFGIVAIAMTLITVVEAVMDLPLIQSLISIADLKRSHLDTAFTLGLARGLALALILGLLSWPFAQLYHDARLLPLIAALALAPAARGLTSPAMALYARQISFHRDFLLEITGKLASFSIAISVAFATHSYWALVASSVVAPLTAALASYAIAPYRPRLSLAEWPAFIVFLGWSSAGQVLAAVNWQCDRFLISRNTSRAALGEFSMANDLSILPVQALLVPLLRPLTAAFALCRHDRERLAAAYLKTSTALLAAVLPVGVGLSALAIPAVRLVLGPSWAASAPIVQWLALAMIAGAFVVPMGALAMAVGRTEVSFRQGLVEFCAKIPLVLAGVTMAGIPGVIAARMVTAAVTVASATLLVRHMCCLSARQQISHAWRILAAGGVMYGVLRLLQGRTAEPSDLVGLGLALLAFGAIGLFAYFVSWLAFWMANGRPAGIERDAIAAAETLLASRRRQGLPG